MSIYDVLQAKIIQFKINVIVFYILLYFTRIYFVLFWACKDSILRFSYHLTWKEETFAKKVLCQKICEFFSSRKLFPHHFLPLKVFCNRWKNSGRSHWQEFWIVWALEKFIMYVSLSFEKNLKTVNESIFNKVVGIAWIPSHELCKDFSKF